MKMSAVDVGVHVEQTNVSRSSRLFDELNGRGLTLDTTETCGFAEMRERVIDRPACSADVAAGFLQQKFAKPQHKGYYK